MRANVTLSQRHSPEYLCLEILCSCIPTYVVEQAIVPFIEERRFESDLASLKEPSEYLGHIAAEQRSAQSLTATLCRVIANVLLTFFVLLHARSLQSVGQRLFSLVVEPRCIASARRPNACRYIRSHKRHWNVQTFCAICLCRLPFMFDKK